MRITTDHATSSYGMPVILDDDGNPVNYAEGLWALRERYELSRHDVAEICGVSYRTVEAWEQARRLPGAQPLLALSNWLRKQRRRS